MIKIIAQAELWSHNQRLILSANIVCVDPVLQISAIRQKTVVVETSQSSAIWYEQQKNPIYKKFWTMLYHRGAWLLQILLQMLDYTRQN